MRLVFITLLLISLPTAVLQAQVTPVSTFLAKANALKKRGPLALLSSDYGRLKAEVNNSAKALGAEQLAAQRTGWKPATCMPKSISIGTNELLNHFSALPQAEQGMSVKVAFTSFINKKYPCRS